MRFQNFPDVVQYLYSKLPYFSRDGKAAYKSDIGNITALVSAIGNPHKKFNSIHIAGTNGKGSTSHLLAAIFQSANYQKVGLYTSPHLLHFTERIKINGQEIPESFVTGFVADNYNLIEQIRPSFVELTGALAFDWFANQQVDIAVIETGLGGRLDSTNIISPLLSVITNISWDHQDLLGNTLEKIAWEKSGIIKPQTPCVIGESTSEISAVFRAASIENQSPLFEAERLGTIEQTQHRWIWKPTNKKEIEFESPLSGYYQRFNFRTVLAAIKILQENGVPVSDSAIWEGFSNVVNLTGLRGRWEVAQRNPMIIVDVAHNRAGVSEIVAQINRTRHILRWHIVWGMVGDKDILPVLELLPQTPIYYWCAAQSPRSLPVDKLFQAAQRFGLAGNTYPSVVSALKSAINKSQSDDCILITGSTFVVAEALQYIKTN